MSIDYKKIFEELANSQEFQEYPSKLKDASNQEYTGFAGQGKIKVSTVSNKSISSITIDDEWYQTHTKEELITALQTAINKLLNKAQKDIEEFQMEMNSQVSTKLMNSLFSGTPEEDK